MVLLPERNERRCLREHPPEQTEGSPNPTAPQQHSRANIPYPIFTLLLDRQAKTARMMTAINRLTVRVYGVYIDSENRILVSDEYIAGQMFTKFPGGGLELGEGLRDALKRECMEELGAEVTVGDHLYTTDFFQPSAFRQGDQIISVYYWFTPLAPLNLPFRDRPFDFDVLQEDAQVFRMIPMEQFSAQQVTFPIDRIVAEMLLHQAPSRF
jgi:8-oxo-dGTP pyrophosphatase MutT (NUDIX family)